MTATVDVEPDRGWVDGDAVSGYLVQVLATVGGLAAAGTGAVGDAVRVDRISLLERVKAAAAAAQAGEVVAFARSQVAAQQTAGVDYRRLGQGIGEQVGLATHTSGWHGARTLTFARDLVTQLPGVFGLLAQGRISEWVARLVATETSHLDPEARCTVDGQLVEQHVEELGPKDAAKLVRKLAYAADPHGAIDQRGRGQVMADAVTERITGRKPADGRPVTLNLTVPLEYLTDPSHQAPGDLTGYGPIPAGLVDDILTRAKDQVWWRRLFTAPDGNGLRIIVGGDPTRRRFTGWLAQLLKLRDGGICREPFCDAPIRHLDHIIPAADGGPTTYGNGRGVCERHNYTRHIPGWHVEVLQSSRHGPAQVIATTTPTGHTYLSRAPDPP